jgi:hypothetical protein
MKLLPLRDARRRLCGHALRHPDTALRTRTLSDADRASGLVRVCAEKRASGSRRPPQTHVGGDPLASPERVRGKLAQCYDGTSDFPVAANKTNNSVQ